MGFFPMGKSGRFSQGKPATTESRYPTLINYQPSVYSIFCVTGCKAYSFTTDGYGIFNGRTQFCARRTHEGEGGGGSGTTNKSAQELTRRDRKKTCPSPCPTRGSTPWSLDLISDALRPPSVLRLPVGGNPGLSKASSF